MKGLTPELVHYHTLEELTQEVASERYDIELNRNLNLLYMCLTQELEN